MESTGVIFRQAQNYCFGDHHQTIYGVCFSDFDVKRKPNKTMKGWSDQRPSMT